MGTRKIWTVHHKICVQNDSSSGGKQLQNEEDMGMQTTFETENLSMADYARQTPNWDHTQEEEMERQPQMHHL